jgi:hypothetical protein
VELLGLVCIATSPYGRLNHVSVVLFYGAVSGRMMVNDELERTWKGAIVA